MESSGFVTGGPSPPSHRSVERSLSPDLVSLSSGSESAEEDLGVSQRLSTSQDDSDITEGPSVPLNLADHDMGGASLTQSVLAGHGGGMETVDRDELESHHSLVQSSQSPHLRSSQLQSSQLSERDLCASTPSGLTSSVLLVDKDRLTVSDYESKGLLYARSSKARHNM